jgi:uroporphyrin-III C-methyltransferase
VSGDRPRPVRTPTVTLLGAGPGDPELLTIKAVKALRRATVALVDDLVDDGVLRYLRRTARVVRVGKRGGGRPCAAGLPATRASTPQAFIDRLMIAEARRGETVVRIKGGDPCVFGRGGEEADALRAAGIGVEVVPGITAGLGAPAAAGVPVTDRRHAPGVALVTGHSRAGGRAPDWAALARSGLTIVIYMGLGRIAALRGELLAAGLGGETPAALIEQGCTPRMRSHRTTLDRLADDAARLAFAAPALIVVGDVLRLGAGFAAADPGRAGTG